MPGAELVVQGCLSPKPYEDHMFRLTFYFIWESRVKIVTILGSSL